MKYFARLGLRTYPAPPWDVRVWDGRRYQEGVTSSIGIAPNKLLAKHGSDMVKPDGLVLISPEDVAEVLQDRPVQDLCGIGPHLRSALAAMVIRTCGELGRAPLQQLTARFGTVGEQLRDMGRGIDRSEVVTLAAQEAEESRSIGHSMTLERDSSEREQLERHVLQLAEKVGRRMRGSGYYGRTVSLTLRYADFTTFSRQRRLRRSVRHGLDIYAAAVAIFRELSLEQPVRLLGVSVSGLERSGEQVPLFPSERRQACTSLGPLTPKSE